MLDANQIAMNILEQFWDKNLPVDIDQIAQEMGIEVKYSATVESIVASSGIHTTDDTNYNISGRFDLVNERPTCTIRDTDSEVRQRFTLAHEIGHYVLGHGSGFRDNSFSFNLNNRDYREVAANVFAAELLMPKIAVDYLIMKENISLPSQLAGIFNVSEVAMQYRLKNLGWL